MRKQAKHITLLTRTPSVAQTTLQIKLEGTTEMIDRLLLIDRQRPWKATGPTGDTDDTTDTGDVDTDL